MNLLGRAMEKEFWFEVREKDCFKGFRDNLLDDWKHYEEEGDLLALKYSEF